VVQRVRVGEHRLVELGVAREPRLVDHRAVRVDRRDQRRGLGGLVGRGARRERGPAPGVGRLAQRDLVLGALQAVQALRLAVDLAEPQVVVGLLVDVVVGRPRDEIAQQAGLLEVDAGEHDLDLEQHVGARRGLRLGAPRRRLGALRQPDLRFDGGLVRELVGAGDTGGHDHAQGHERGDEQRHERSHEQR